VTRTIGTLLYFGLAVCSSPKQEEPEPLEPEPVAKAGQGGVSSSR
jgi:hypothetical protein